MMYERYCYLRDNKKVKDADVARNTGIPKSTFSDWKSGKSAPKQDKLQKIADYFGVTVDYLMTGKDPQIDYLYSDDNADLLIDITKNIKNDSEFAKRIAHYMSLLSENKKSVDDMIDLMYSKEHNGEDYSSPFSIALIY